MNSATPRREASPNLQQGLPSTRYNPRRVAVLVIVYAVLCALCLLWAFRGRRPPQYPAAECLVPPVDDYRVDRAFGVRSQDGSEVHLAEDVELPAYTPVFAIAPGYVAYAGTAPGFQGIIVVEHRLSDGTVFRSIYGHLEPIAFLVREREIVTGGQEIGYLAETDDEKDEELETPRLHFGLRKGPHDPWVWEAYGWGPEELLTEYYEPSAFLAAHRCQRAQGE
ncbi:MAG: M23 family metallopeptidase [Chloroflexota bacterium]|nr:M23 family metallopeptidase [Chloroflexota bacterium]